jgi:hypothetical protein
MNDQVDSLPFSKHRQPDAVPEHPVPSPPSLWTYGILLLIAALLVGLAFREKTDWPGLFINLASGIVGAVIVLVFVKRRFRQSEIQRVRSFPRRLRFLFGFILSPTERECFRYARVFRAELRQALKGTIRLEYVQTLFPRIAEGFLLLGPPGSGKTTSLQFVASALIEEYLNSPTSKALPVCFLWRDGSLRQILRRPFLST